MRFAGKVLGICGGYQMLGHNIHDPTGLEGTAGSSQSLGDLPIHTILQIEKQLTHSQGKLFLKTDKDSQVTVTGYQILLGITQRYDRAKGFYD
jgi:adenosylcobyric acid synthase